MVLLFLLGGCAAPATELKACPSGDCEAEARVAKQALESQRENERLRAVGLINRASFDLNCPGRDIVVVELSDASRGVRGCGKQAAYARRWGMPEEWVLDSPVTAMR
ncbi:MAG TPA: hypothetical protein VF945_05325 [Polyangia bacterium]